uniref:DUF7638 domain-containing protein n=1 Tax=Paenibacillus albidus TaxID=2041023 RepID=UPI0027E4D0E9|nr:hypothetical protein [Paenibacillus albidus]
MEGTKIGGIIHNGSYFYIGLEVYEDGMMNCWELVDLAGLKEKLEKGWLVTEIPAGQHLSIHGLGSYKVLAADWQYSAESYYEQVVQTIRQLNPDWSNIYQVTAAEKERNERRRVSHSPKAVDFYLKRELFYETKEGEGFTLFMKHEGGNHLVHLVVYEDGRVICHSAAVCLELDLEQVKAYIQDGIFFTAVEQPTVVILDHLGELTLAEGGYAADLQEKYKELEELELRLKGGKTAHELCRQAYYNYLEYPTEYNRTRLKELYENVPEHQRMFLGDMDSKDSDYIRIIYHPEEKREV